jgi:PQQ enzyme repeat
LAETVLTPSLLETGGFGRLFSLPVDGNIYAQPLYVQSVSVPSVRRDRIERVNHAVVYVATEHNTVYAFDADAPGSPLWSRNLGTSVLSDDYTRHMRAVNKDKLGAYRSLVYRDLTPEIGITSTPVIDEETNTIYVVAKTKEGMPTKPAYYYRLHAMDLGTGEEKFPARTIQATLNNQGKQDVSGKFVFDAFLNLNRPGLLLTHGRVYVAFGGIGDQPPYCGWVFAYDANLKGDPYVFCTTLAEERGGGIWQSGNGLVTCDHKDGSPLVYFMTGNGAFDGKTAFGDSFVGLKMGPQPSVLTYFTPFNQEYLDKQDVDLGSSGPVLVPGTNLVLGGGKEGKLYLLDRLNMGGYSKDDETTERKKIIQSFQVTSVPTVPNPSSNDYRHIHGAPVFWNRQGEDALVYVWGEMDFLKAYNLHNQRFPARPDGSVTPFMQSTTQAPLAAPGAESSMPGGMLALSSNGDQNGILWATLPVKNANQAVVEGVFFAFRATDISKPVWRSTDNPRDKVGFFAKFCAPTIVNGKVYLATFADPQDPIRHPAQLVVYGRLARGAGTDSGH